LDRDSREIRLGRHLDILNDGDNKLGIQEVNSPGYRDRFKPSGKGVPAFGFTRSAIWLRFTVNNKDVDPVECLLDVQTPILDEVDLYIPSGNGFVLQRSGDHTPFSERVISYRTIVLPLVVSPGSHTYYLRVRSSSYMNIPVVLWTPPAFFAHANKELPVFWMFYGLLLILVVYNCFIFFSSRDINYLYYSFFIMSFVLFHFSYNGFAGQYLWGDMVWWSDVCIPVFLSLTALTFILFSRSFLRASSYSPGVDRALVCGCLAFALLTGLSLIIDYQTAVKTIDALCLLFLVFMMIAGFIAMGKGSREAVFYMGAWGLFIFGTMLHIMKNFGLLPETFITIWSQQVGVVLQAVLLSLGLADRINTMRLEVEESHSRLLESNKLLDEERDLLFVTINCIADGVISVDPQGRIFLMNRWLRG
jgi:adenylate cyclase